MCLMHDAHQFNVLDNIRHAHVHANAIKLYGQLHYVMYIYTQTYYDFNSLFFFQVK